jgi:hypothetical protein
VRHEGRVTAAGIEKDVSFVPADEQMNEELDALYRSKYEHYGDGPLSPDNGITSPQARSTTIRLVPR